MRCTPSCSICVPAVCQATFLALPVQASRLDFAMFFLLSVSVLQADVATVLRGKRLIGVPACDLVPGDIVDIAGGLAPNAQLLVFFNFYGHNSLEGSETADWA